MGAALVAAAGLFLLAAPAEPAQQPEQARADIIVIDGLKTFGPLERPAVVFLHDKHTEALARQGKNCLACHPQENDRFSLKFQRTEDAAKQRVMEIYHQQCVNCHQETRSQQKDSGPVTCGGCHSEEPSVQSDFQPIGMDRSLHARHVKAAENRCERCHHKYNPQTQKLFYAKGQEEACLYCHKDKTEDNRISLRLAAHDQCIACHRARVAEKKPAGPSECAGCHSPERQALHERIESPPRIERNQPHVTLVRTHAQDEPQTALPASMARATFDHKSHEGVTGYCRTCHHAAITPCADCHTIQSRKEGAGVKLAQAMHQVDAPMSCVGCHQTELQKPACAGCHGSIPQQRVWASEASCKVCHVPMGDENYPQDKAQAEELAAQLLESRRLQSARPMFKEEDIPDQVSIGHLVDQFEAVQMPHRRIALRLTQMTRDSRLAGAFHAQAATLCQGCHHNSPPSPKPPRCGSCHGRTSDALNPTRPGLMAAFHEQCFDCHDRMGILKPDNRDCTACHARRSPENRS